MKPKAIVLRVPGINCENELIHSLNLVGFNSIKIHLNELVKQKNLIEEAQLIAFPGGFSYGDYLGSARVFANKLKFKLKNELKNFIENEGLMLGICNGFQLMVKTGILPAINHKYFEEQEVTLTFNDSANFQCEWVELEKKSNKCIFTKKINSIMLPIAHGEGKLIVKNEKILKEIERKELIAFTYKVNPNGSTKSIAALTNESGLILGLMPHPERNIYWLNDCRSYGKEKEKKFSDGLKIFENAFNFAKKKLK